MDISAVAAPLPPMRPPETNLPKPPEVQNGVPADGTRTPKPTQVAPLPPGQGTRVDQLA